MSETPDTFYKTFSEKQLTSLGGARRGRIERGRLALLMKYASPPGPMLEIGPGHGSLAALAIEAAGGTPVSQVLRSRTLRSRASTWCRRDPSDPAPCYLPRLYADQSQHIRHRRRPQFTRTRCAFSSPGGSRVVPDYLKERGFFWDIDYTHNFPTTERRVRQLFNDGGFTTERVVRSIGVATGPARDLLAGAALLANIPGLDALSRYTRTEELLYKVRKNLFETLTFVARKPIA